ncbi:MAG: hypothetical protein ACOCXH_06915 [Cyclobacteriaceae bacterium]
MTAILILLINFSVTLFMTGLVWFVQVIHYPLYLKITTNFEAYELMHTRLTSRLTAPLMLLELFTTVLMWWFWPSYYVLNIIISLMLAIIWVSTFFVQIPLHNKLCQLHDKSNCHKLVKTNWVRTIAWTLKGLTLAVYFLEIAML